MTFRGDDRAVTVQIGAVLLFGLLVISMSMYQATVVPRDNERVEFRHSERVGQDLLSLHGAITAAAAGDPRTAQVELGTRYPPRTLFVNPPPVTGTLRSTDAGVVTVRNAVAVGDPETADYWNGAARSFETDRLTYRADYNAYSDAPSTVVEHGVVVDRYENGAELPRTEQTLVRGRTVDLVGLATDVSASRTGAYAVAPRAVSPAARTVAVANDSRPVLVEFRTVLSLDTWRDLLANQAVAAGGHVRNVTRPTDGTVRIELEPGVTYRLRMAAVAIGTNAGTSAAYLTTVDGPTTGVATAGDAITVEARDRFNNPVEGVTVEVVDGAHLITATSAPTDADGRATFAYDGDGEGTLTLRIGDGVPAYETVELHIRRGEDGADRLVAQSVQSFDADGDGNEGGFEIVFQNTHGTRVNVTNVGVLPHGRQILGLAEHHSGEGKRRSELHVEALGGGANGTVDVPVGDGSDGLLSDPYFLYVSSRGVVLSTTQNRSEQIYDGSSYRTVETNTSGTPAVLAGERVRVTFTEFYAYRASDREPIDASDYDFTVTISYECGGDEFTDTFVVRPQ